MHIVDTITSDSNHDCYLLQLAVNSSGTQMRTIVSISPPERITVAAAQSSGPPTTDRMGNLEKQMGLVIETLTNMSSEMKSFQKAVSNMDVLVRSVQELQESESWRSGMSGVNTRSSLSTPPLSHAGNPVLASTSDTGTGNNTVSQHGSHKSPLRFKLPTILPTPLVPVAGPTMASDLRADRLVKIAAELKSTFRVRLSGPSLCVD